MKLPEKITPDPIIEAVVEVRFKPSLHPEAVFGVAYSALKDRFNKVEQLPILQLPEAFRSKDPQLYYAPYYSLSYADDLSVKLGPRVLTFSNIHSYVGWPKFFEFVNDTLKKLETVSILNEAERIGIRYISLFKHSILDKIKMELNVGETVINEQTTNFRVEIKEGNFLKILQIANNVSIQSPNYDGLGSLIDIDCIYNSLTNKNDFFSKIDSILTEGHQIEKKTFFTLLNEDFLNKLNPRYPNGH